MSDRERVRPLREHLAGEPADPTTSDGLDAVRASADRLLQAADEAIARALSQDSERFLEATRQSSGQ